jgi:hypothetical protein
MSKIGRRARAAVLSAIFGLAWIPPQAVAQTNAGPARFEETDPSVSYTVGWTQGDTSRTWSGGTAAISSAPGAQATITFTGTSVSWAGTHTLSIQVIGKNPISTDAWILIDAFDVIP